jgi:hypothetical protein
VAYKLIIEANDERELVDYIKDLYHELATKEIVVSGFGDIEGNASGAQTVEVFEAAPHASATITAPKVPTVDEYMAAVQAYMMSHTAVEAIELLTRHGAKRWVDLTSDPAKQITLARVYEEVVNATAAAA